MGKKPEIILIAAMARNRSIGFNQQIPWHIPGELKRFKKTTWGYPVIMGRKTFESIGKALPGRRNIILTRNRAFKALGCESAESLAASIKMCAGADKAFILGGEQIFIQAMPVADTIILTALDRDFPGDTFFPEIPDHFAQVDLQRVVESEPYSILIYQRAPK